MTTTIQETIEGGDGAEAQRTAARARNLLPSFKEALGLGESQPLPPEAEFKCITFIVEVILPIPWYSAKIKRAWLERGAYIVLVAVLTLLVPIGLTLLARWNSGQEYYLAQIGGILTGLIALQRLIGVTLLAHHRYGAWWKASAELKKLWYGLLTARRALPAGATTTWPEIRDDIDRAIDQARTVVAEEQTDFFQKLTLPSFDLAEQLSKARTDISGLVTGLIPGAAAVSSAVATQTADLLKAKQDLARADTLVSGLAKEIEDATNRLTTLTATSPPEQKKALTDLFADLSKRRGEAVIKKREAEAALAAATAR